MSDKNEFAGFLQPGWRVAGDVVRAGITERERAVLDAAAAWREAEHAAEVADERLYAEGLDYAVANMQALREADDKVNTTLNALRAAVDKLKGVKESEG